jgi:hypothetical protein
LLKPLQQPIEFGTLGGLERQTLLRGMLVCVIVGFGAAL